MSTLPLTPADVAARLCERFGAGLVASGEAIAARHHADWSGHAPIAPAALARPRDTAEVAAVLAWCHEHAVPVVPQGGMTGLAGGAVPQPGGVALSLERMNAIEAVDPLAGTLTAQAGATLQAVHEAAAARGMLFGVDLGARGSCQIGGNLSTNAGGNGVLQFGMMREQTLGLEVVLADGTVLPMLRPMVKNNTGYDLKHWFIGAEGTLGVITRALLRLRPAPAARLTALVALPTFEAALALLARLQERFAGGVAAFELMWRDFVEASVRWQSLREPFAAAHPLCALVELTGSDAAELEAGLASLLSAAISDGTAADAVLAQSIAQARELWRLREATAELPARMHPAINFDVSLPTGAIGEVAHACAAALTARWSAQQCVRFGHIGDGNLHLSVDGATVGGDVEAVERLVYEAVAARGGSVSAEHGIGTHKKPWLGASRTPAEIAAMRAIKAALDPRGILNPGKIFDPA